MPQVSYWRIAFLALVVLSVNFVELGSARLWDRDEPRNARASHEMLARGDWIVPTFNGSLRDHKPILIYWGQMLSYLALGESEFSARLPSALCALLAVMTVAVLASRLSGKQRGISPEGFWGAACMATCGLFVMAGRAATPDASLIAFSTLGIAALVISSLAPAFPYSSGHVGQARWVPAMFGYTMLGLAALAKGPVGIVLPLIVVHGWWLICHRLQIRDNLRSRCEGVTGMRGVRAVIIESWMTFNPLQCLRSIIALRTIPGLLLTLFAAAPWYVAVGIETNGQFLRGFFLEHNVGRALGSMEGHQGSLLFYPVAFLVGTFPWSMWLIPVVGWCRRASRESVVQRQLVVLSTVWIAVYICAFSVASTKLPSYITPCYAGAALALSGYWRAFENAWSRPTWLLRRIAYLLTIVVGVAIAGGIAWLSQHESMPLLSRAALSGVVICVVGVLAFWWERREALQRLPLTWLSGAALFHVLLFGFGSKSVDLYRQDLEALTQVSSRNQQTSLPGSQRYLSIGGMEPSWVHYLGQEIVEVTEPAGAPSAWQRVEDFIERFPEGRLIVVGDDALESFERWRSKHLDREFEEVANAPRFLRPGNLRVFEGRAACVGGLRDVERVGNTGAMPVNR